MKRLLNLIKQDLTITLRNRFHYAVIFLAILFIILINFLVPTEVKMTPSELIADLTPEQFMITGWKELGIPEERCYDSEEELIAAMKKKKNSIGIVVQGTKEEPEFTIIQQGHEPASSINYLVTSLEYSLDELGIKERPSFHQVEYLRVKSSVIPFNKNLIPIVLATEVVLLGFILIAVMVFQEKGEGSIKAYRITPGKVWEYILSKGLTNVLLSVIYGLLLVIFTMGVDLNYLHFLFIIILTSSFASLLGLWLSVYFRNLSEFMMIAICFITILGLPMGSYFFPAFSNSLIRLIPTYPLLFGMREVLFSTGNTDFMSTLYIKLILANIVVFGLCYQGVRRRLMKEVG